MRNTEVLSLKAEGVKDCVKWVKEQIKAAKQELERDIARRKNAVFGGGDIQSYYEMEARSSGKVDALIEVKIGLEKYMKKLKYMANEAVEVDNAVI